MEEAFKPSLLTEKRVFIRLLLKEETIILLSIYLYSFEPWSQLNIEERVLLRRRQEAFTQESVY
jgi:hypothetical protein